MRPPQSGPGGRLKNRAPTTPDDHRRVTLNDRHTRFWRGVSRSSAEERPERGQACVLRRQASMPGRQHRSWVEASRSGEVEAALARPNTVWCAANTLWHRQTHFGVRRTHFGVRQTVFGDAKLRSAAPNSVLVTPNKDRRRQTVFGAQKTMFGATDQALALSDGRFLCGIAAKQPDSMVFSCFAGHAAGLQKNAPESLPGPSLGYCSRSEVRRMPTRRWGRSWPPGWRRGLFRPSKARACAVVR